jgi:uncharacterized membrane protein YcgQ (UPF0703/DUF1980 family)
MRKKLKDYLNQVVTLRGQIRYYEWYYRHHKAIYRYCIEKPTLNNEVVCEHMWVESKERFKKGKWLEVSGEIVQYTKKGRTGKSILNYGIGDVISIHRIDSPGVSQESQKQNNENDSNNDSDPNAERNEGK